MKTTKLSFLLLLMASAMAIGQPGYFDVPDLNVAQKSIIRDWQKCQIVYTQGGQGPASISILYKSHENPTNTIHLPRGWYVNDMCVADNDLVYFVGQKTTLNDTSFIGRFSANDLLDGVSPAVDYYFFECNYLLSNGNNTINTLIRLNSFDRLRVFKQNGAYRLAFVGHMYMYEEYGGLLSDTSILAVFDFSQRAMRYTWLRTLDNVFTDVVVTDNYLVGLSRRYWDDVNRYCAMAKVFPLDGLNLDSSDQQDNNFRLVEMVSRNSFSDIYGDHISEDDFAVTHRTYSFTTNDTAQLLRLCRLTNNGSEDAPVYAAHQYSSYYFSPFRSNVTVEEFCCESMRSTAWFMIKDYSTNLLRIGDVVRGLDFSNLSAPTATDFKYSNLKIQSMCSENTLSQSFLVSGYRRFFTNLMTYSDRISIYNHCTTTRDCEVTTRISDVPFMKFTTPYGTNIAIFEMKRVFPAVNHYNAPYTYCE